MYEQDKLPDPIWEMIYEINLAITIIILKESPDFFIKVFKNNVDKKL